jgi:DNA polymerase-3 subunit delta'
VTTEAAPDTPGLISALPWQLSLVEELVDLKQSHRLPHAILIEMKTRVDSREFGWYLAGALLCKQPTQDKRPCGSCEHCRLMQANSYPDFTFTTLQENERSGKLNKDIKIDQIRRLIHQLALTPDRDAGKMALIYPAERMNLSAANSLLKTLEEPAQNSTLVLLTHHAARLPVTIRSRCQHRSVNNPPPKEAAKWCIEQGIAKDEIEPQLSLAHGDPEYAVQLSEQDFTRHLQAFQVQLQEYLSGKSDVISLINSSKGLDNEWIRHMIRNILHKFVLQQLNEPLDHSRKNRLRALLDLINHSNFVLQVEENNLNLQLQLEDVLISLKQIINEEYHHGGTQSGYPVTEYQG